MGDHRPGRCFAFKSFGSLVARPRTCFALWSFCENVKPLCLFLRLPLRKLVFLDSTGTSDIGLSEGLYSTGLLLLPRPSSASAADAPPTERPPPSPTLASPLGLLAALCLADGIESHASFTSCISVVRRRSACAARVLATALSAFRSGDVGSTCSQSRISAGASAKKTMSTRQSQKAGCEYMMASMLLNSPHCESGTVGKGTGYQ
mmetsp:Transcript_20112/g.43476  ORF Transcript_20112/g.43476 Transcript_20112/m.43476 type:complete len:205 (+) Transcript_20112:618-1232(+)